MDLTPEALEALRGSIDKWEGILAGTEVDFGVFNCPLCRIFRKYLRRGDGQGDAVLSCEGCPVADKAGIDQCMGTPYVEWERYLEQTDEVDVAKVFDNESRRLAQVELDFLRSLLPEGVEA